MKSFFFKLIHNKNECACVLTSEDLLWYIASELKLHCTHYNGESWTVKFYLDFLFHIKLPEGG